ncbi:MAG: phosphotransferase [Desulfobacterales bacterium]|nr:MAG: phosphotransferase [Desulfobacterales bacterium]
MKEYFNFILSTFYDLGRLIHIERSHRGYINETFKLNLLKNNKKDHYVLRRYRTGTPKKRIAFEHALMLELIKQGFNISPLIIPTKDHATFVKIPSKMENRIEDRYISIFTMLPGKDKYSWNNPLCTDAELRDAAKVLASYHGAIYEWKGIDAWTDQRNIDRIVLMSKRWQYYAQHAGESSFDQYFLEQFEYLCLELNKIQFKKIYNEMPHLAIHGDYHPGNLKFENEKVIGVFDFDWSKIDIRCFDVALALLYFCSSWDGIDEGHILLDRTESFLEAYQKVAGEIDTIGPLDTMELEHLPEMIHLSNLFLIDWILEACYSSGRDYQEYKTYLRHSVQMMRWMDSHRDQLYTRVLKFENVQ